MGTTIMSTTRMPPSKAHTTDSQWAFLHSTGSAHAHSPVAEARAHAEEVLARARRLGGGLQPEEGVMLDGALPQVLCRLLVVKPADDTPLSQSHSGRL